MTQSPPLLTEFVINLLTPFLLTGPLKDPEQARRIMQETIEGYYANTTGQLVSVTQIVAFTLSAVDNLRLALPEAVATTTRLRLRSNANALNLSAQRATKNLESQRQQPPPPPKPDTKPTDTKPQETKPQETDKVWAGAMTNVAKDFKNELPNLPPAEQKIQQARIDALDKVAHQLNTGTAPSLRSRLLSGTSLLTPIQGPSHSL